MLSGLFGFSEGGGCTGEWRWRGGEMCMGGGERGHGVYVYVCGGVRAMRL